MEAHYPKYVLYGVLILGAWLISCLLHFQFIQLSLFASRPDDSGPSLIVLPLSVPIALDASSQLPAPDAIAEQDGALRRLSSAASTRSCEGRFVYMLDVPPRFDVLRECVEGSPAFQDEYHMCSLMANAGMGPLFHPATGDGSDGDTGIIPNTGWYNTDQYSLEVIVHNRMRRYECLTDDPAEATAVYVPYYPALEVQQHVCGFNASVRNGPSSEFLRWLSSRPHWAAFGGRDHFVVAAKTTWMFRHNEVDGDGNDWVCGNNFLEQPETGNMTVLTYESNLWARRREDFAVPYPSYFHPTSARAVAAWQARVRAADRPRLFAFAGARRAVRELAIRDRIIDSCALSTRCGLVDCSHGLQGFLTCHSPRRIVSVFASSRFCLQPPGDSFMRRSSVDSIMAGCIPVFFREPSTFEKQYRWHHPDPDGGDRQYWVLIDPDQVLEGKVSIEEVLARYTDQEVAAMREEVIKMIPRFLYKDPRVNFQGEMRDAFDIAFDEVMARMRRIKKGENLGWPVDDDMVAPKDS